MNLVTMPLTFPVTSHTDFVGENSIFVAIQGQQEDGVKYCGKAIGKGARTLVIQHDVELPQDIVERAEHYSVVIKKIGNSRKALAELSAEHAGFPAKKLKIIGITGTKGKTTTAFLIEHVLRTAGYKTSLISSVKNKILDISFTATLTTPQPDYLHQFLKCSLENDVEYVVMEVAAQALSLYRVYGIEFDGIIFTNFSHEHLEFYATLDDYYKAKCSIFDQSKQAVPIVINADDACGKFLLSQMPQAIGYSLSNVNTHCDSFVAQYDDSVVDRVVVTMTMSDIVRRIECTFLLGRYNAYNVLAATIMVCKLGVPFDVIQKALRSFAGVPGRLDHYVMSNKARFFIDYAHNPDSFNAVLSTLRLLTDNLIVVFGAGGNRDKEKRPLMGLVASQYADTLIITSDNPRSEDPSDIAEAIISGIPEDKKNNVIRELDRKKAIEHAYGLSHAGTIIALLGKGPDEYQLTGTKKYFFSEKNIIRLLV